MAHGKEPDPAIDIEIARKKILIETLHIAVLLETHSSIFLGHQLTTNPVFSLSTYTPEDEDNGKPYSGRHVLLKLWYIKNLALDHIEQSTGKIRACSETTESLHNLKKQTEDMLKYANLKNKSQLNIWGIPLLEYLNTKITHRQNLQGRAAKMIEAIVPRTLGVPNPANFKSRDHDHSS